jgi:hypothetical protein
MISSKVMYDATYSNKSWCIIAQDIFSLREINQMESTMCAILDWELTVNDPILANFTKAVKADFGEDTSEYPDYPIVFVSRRAARALASMPRDGNSDLTCLFPGFGTHPMPSDSHLESTSSASPTTPVRGPGQETNLNIRGVDISPGLGCVESVPAMHPLKPEMFAYVAPSDW